MLKRLTRKFFILFMLCAAFVAVVSAPAPATGRQILICQEVPMTSDCPSGYWCCDTISGNCGCAN